MICRAAHFPCKQQAMMTERFDLMQWATVAMAEKLDSKGKPLHPRVRKIVF